MGVSQGPSANEVASRGVAKVVRRLDREFRAARAAEVEQMLEAAKAQELATEEGAVPTEERVPAAERVAPEEQTEEILLDVKPK